MGNVESDNGTTEEQKLKLVLVNDEHLTPLVTKPNFFTYLKQSWHRRHFSFAHAKTGAMSAGRDRYLGKLWIILDPIFQVAVYALLFGLILKVSRGMDNFVGFLIIGVVFFGFFSKGISGSSGIIQSSRALISSFKFPRILLVVSEVIKAIINNAIPAVLAIVFAVLFQLGEPLHWTIILVLPLYFLIHVFLFGAGLIIARVTAFIPDFKSMVSLFMRGMFFLSGVFFSIQRFDTHPTIKSLVEANPIYQFLMAIRSCVLEGEIPAGEVWLYLTLWTLGLNIIGLLYFWAGEERYAGVR